MTSKRNVIVTSLGALALSLSLAGCSDYGGTGPAAAKMVTGVAATGAPVVGAVTLKDSSPTPAELTRMTASDGSFAFHTAGLTPPFILRTTANTKLYSLATDNGIVNLTPLTTMALSQAAAGADLDALYDRPVQADIKTVAARMPEAVQAVHAALAPLMETFGCDSTNILTGQFSANHTGMDALLDAVSVTIDAGAVTVANRESGAAVFTAPRANLRAGTIVAANMPAPPGPQSPSSGAAIYATRCAGCHRVLVNSNLKGRVSVTAAQSAIGSNLGGMGNLSDMTAADLQAVSDAITAQGSTPPSQSTPPSAAPDGAALYAANCAGCHGALPNSTKLGATVVRIQNAISGNVGGMGFLANLTAADIQAIVTALNPPGSGSAPTTPPPADTATSPAPGGAALYAANCATCHGALAVSSKQGITIARLQGAIANNIGNMGPLSRLTVAEVQAIVTALTPSTQTSPPPPPAAPDGAALYGSNCAGCHNPLASSEKGGATAVRIQSAINGNVGGMGYLSTLSSPQVNAIATVLADIAPPSTPTPACGSCHAIPPATGRHSTHKSQGVSCATCHGSGYGNTAVNASTHSDGVKDVAGTIGWNATNRNCSNSCHGRKSW